VIGPEMECLLLGKNYTRICLQLVHFLIGVGVGDEPPAVVGIILTH
jgi:hypothetical protein